MKVGELKKLLESVDDGLEVVISGSDHSYLFTYKGSKVLQAEMSRSGRHLGEFWGNEYRSYSDSKIVEVFWIDVGGAG